MSYLVEIIGQMSQAFEGVFVIVDALHECRKHTIEVTKILTTLPAADRWHNVKVTLLKRGEANIAHILKNSVDHFQLGTRSEDLSLFVAEEMDKRMGEGILEVIMV